MTHVQTVSLATVVPHRVMFYVLINVSPDIVGGSTTLAQPLMVASRYAHCFSKVEVGGGLRESLHEVISYPRQRAKHRFWFALHALHR